MLDKEDITARQRELESQLAQLQRHVEQQDREMMAMSERLRRLEAEHKTTRQRIGSLEESQGGSSPASERPPHY